MARTFLTNVADIIGRQVTLVSVAHIRAARARCTANRNASVNHSRVTVFVGTPRYFFDFTDTGKVFLDVVGTDLPDLEAAKQEAVKALVEITKDKLPDGPSREFVMTVRDESNETFLEAMIKFEMRAR